MFKKFIRDIPDFPEKGIIFKDITPLLQNKDAFREAIMCFKNHYQDIEIDYIAAIEARGFLFGTPLALAMNKGFIPIRKVDKLPGEKISASYQLEYGKSELEIHKDALQPGDKVLLVDDLLATGGTVKAAVDLIEELGAQVMGIAFLMELSFLKGREKIRDYDLFCIIEE